MNMISLNNECKWTVYIHISPSNKYYIGITSRPVEKRWRSNGIEYKSQYFHRAIEKYGWDNFQHEVIASNLTEEEAKNFEKILIAKLKSNNPEYGYNITSGGDGHPGVKLSEEQINSIKKAVSKAVYQFDKEMNFINEFPSARDAVRKLGLSSKSGILNVCNGKNQTAYGYVWRFKSDIKNPFDRDSLNGVSYKYNQDGIYQINIATNEYIAYDNAKIASKITGYNYNCIIRCCHGITQSYKGYVWKYKKDIDDINEYMISILNRDIGKNRMVLQYDMAMNYITEYPSIKEAAIKNNVSQSGITDVCGGRSKSCGGYIWKYKFDA